MSGAPGSVPPRVLLLGKGWFPDQLGGLNRMYRDLYEALPAATRSGVVLGPARDPTPGLRVVSDHAAPMWRRQLAYWRAGSALARSADVIDGHFALYALALTFAGPASRRPWVVHFQGPWAEEATLQGDRSPLRHYARRAVERRVYGRAERLLVLSGAFRDELVQRYGVRPWDIDVVPPGVDLERFTPGDRSDARRRVHAHADGFTVSCVRRLVPRMGIEHLIQAWHLAQQAGLPATARLIIAGEGPLRADLERSISRKGLEASVRLAGRVSDEELVMLYRAADVNAVPTLDQEGFGLIVLEAAACGTPSIVTDAGGLPEVASGLDPELVVPAGDPQAIADRLVTAARGSLPDRIRTREYAEAYSWDEMATRRERIYQAVANDTRDPRRRVVFLDHVGQLSGGELALFRLLPHLDGVDPHVILFEDGPFAARLRRAGVSTEVLPLDPRVGELRKESVGASSLSPRVLWGTARFTLRLRRRLRRLRPDLVHTNSLKAGVIGGAAARLAGIPVVWHLRDRIAPDYLPRPAVALVRWWIRTVATGVIANSRPTAQTLLRRSRRRRGDPPVAVIPAPVTRVSDRRPPAGERPFTVGMVGRIAPWKGQDVFLRAFAEAFPDGSEHAIVVGSAMFGEDEFATTLPKLADDLGIGGRVTWCGFVDDVSGELTRMDVLVHASRIPEPFGQVVLEGMAAGVPVVAAAGGGPSEIISSGDNGLLYPPGDVSALAAAIRALHADPAQAARLVAGGRRRAELFSGERVAADVLATYARALGDAPQAA